MSKRADHRRPARLGLFVDAVARYPGGVILPDIVRELKLTAFRSGAVYADVALLESRGLVTHCWDHERKRMSWTATTPTTKTGA